MNLTVDKKRLAQSTVGCSSRVADSAMEKVALYWAGLWMSSDSTR